jgi:YtkA-like protein
MTRALSAVALAATVALLAPPPAVAHDDQGRAEPRIAAQARGSGFNRTLIVRLTDLDSGQPISGATVKVKTRMTRPHVMELLTRTIPERRPSGTYRLPYTFVMPGDWTAEFQVSGAKVVPATAELPVPIEAQAPPPGQAQPNEPAPLPTRLETDISERDWISMAVLWLHSISALGWIVGVIVMTIALSTPLLAEGARGSVARAYRSWGAWVHWAAVPLIVATGIYNMVYVTPFELALTPSAIDDLSNVAYGRAYEAILLVKLALFVVLLVSGTLVLMRTINSPALPPGRGAVRTLFTALGASGIVYLASVPLILAAAMALRYVHILSHVAEVINT